ncbi:NYN domain-containing protein, partial [Streptomyces sp. NPDC058953]|uniref:NYN domain-containing protein n=1 Tax=Streptomyces sp. NPDC058953 TaxID=3346676 RepID=UPI0036A31232
MDRCVVLVDAGYLLGAAASLLAGEPARSRITVDHTALIQGLRELAESDTGRPLLRIYWFDGAPDRVPQPEHRRLRVMPRVTVRLGALTRSDGRWAQKGVDAAMHAELTELARNHACSDIVLVTGDGDLLPGLMSAKEHGVAVHLWAVQAAGGDYNQSEDLVAEADERRVLDRSWITGAVRARDLGAVLAPPPAPRPEIAAILSAPLPESALAAAQERAAAGVAETVGPGGPDAAPATGTSDTPATSATSATSDPSDPSGIPVAPAAKGVPTPKDLAGLRGPGVQPPQPPGSATLRWSSDRGWIDRAGTLGEPPETASLPTLAQRTTAQHRRAHRAEENTP